MPITIATATGTYISYLFNSSAPFIPTELAVVSTMSTLNIASYILLSVIIGCVAVLFIHSVYWAEDFFDRIPRSYYVRHDLGMFFVGLSIYIMMRLFGHNYIEGVGYATVSDVLTSTVSHPGFLLLLAFLKVIDTSITLGSGGIFSPSLFIGATLGAGIAVLCNYILASDVAMSLQLGALAGMAGMIGATYHSSYYGSRNDQYNAHKLTIVWYKDPSIL
ncbi:MAG: hypothetical protein CK430_15060 [Legionella sp.]|nr:MAG: hypothetical protein CK430_15060 [Legionella sp.]